MRISGIARNIKSKKEATRRDQKKKKMRKNLKREK